MVTNTAGEVQKELDQEKADELVKPHTPAENGKDKEPVELAQTSTKK